mgnify:CR=1 FL=1
MKVVKKMNTQAQNQVISQFINNLEVFLVKYLKGELEGEEREVLGPITCEHDISEGYTECSVITKAKEDDKKEYYTTDIADADGGYEVPEGILVPVHLEWEKDEENGTTIITATVFHNEIEPKDS